MSYFDNLGKLPISNAGDRAPRQPLDVKVVLTVSNDRELEGVTLNISRSGVLISLPYHTPSLHLEKNELVTVKISPDGHYLSTALVVKCSIRRMFKGKQQETLIGLSFVE